MTRRRRPLGELRTGHPNRPKNHHGSLRWYEVILKCGKRIVLRAEHRGEARHYSKSYRDDYVGSKDHYQDVKHVRLIRHEVSEEIPF